MDKSGKTFEILVSIIENTLKKNPDTKVTHNVELTDNTGNKRQVDVLIEYKADDRFKLKTIIECKDWTSKVKIGTIGEFVDKLKSVGADRGIFVSRSGFQSGAFDKAKHEGVLLYTFDEIDKEIVNSWFKEFILKKRVQGFELKNYYYTIPQAQLDVYQNSPKKMTVYSNKLSNGVKLSDISQALCQKYLRQLCEPIYQDLLKGRTEILNQKTPITFVYHFADDFHFKVNDISIQIVSMILELDVWVYDEEVKGVVRSQYREDDEVKAESIIFEHENSKINIVFTDIGKSKSYSIDKENPTKVIELKSKGNLHYDESIEKLLGFE
jgi:hypothetical protein